MERELDESAISAASHRWKMPLDTVRALAAKMLSVKEKYGYRDLPRALNEWCRREVVNKASSSVEVTPKSPDHTALGDPSYESYRAGCLCYACRCGFSHGATIDQIRTSGPITDPAPIVDPGASSESGEP